MIQVKKVEELFETFQKDTADKAEIASEVCRLLTIRAQIEEIFYPEAEVEHASAKDLIAQIEEVGESDDLFEAKVTVLGEYVRHHVKEEESELFPIVKKTEMNLDAVGAELEARKKGLLSQAIAEGDSAAARRAQEQATQKAKSRK